MWVVAAVLLGSASFAALLGLRAGPHHHLVASSLGLLGACWLVVMAARGEGSTPLWLAFGADLALSGAIGAGAVRALRHPGSVAPLESARLEGQSGFAEGALDPDGTVRVRGESWSAHSLNGRIAPGEPVQVVNVRGLRLEVWAERPLSAGADPFVVHDDEALRIEDSGARDAPAPIAQDGTPQENGAPS
jgi:membrane protein implicated in regulation of membrane protease activity